MPNQGNPYLRIDCADGRFKDVHHVNDRWKLDNVISFPGLVPILGSQGVWDDVEIEKGGLRATMAEMRRVEALGVAIMIEAKQPRAIRIYNHDGCALLGMLGVTEQTPEFIQALLERALTTVVDAAQSVGLPVSAKAHHIRWDDDKSLWYVEKPMAVEKVLSTA